MRSIDVHAHLTPQCFWQATEKGGDWHSLKREKDERGQECAVVGDRRQVLPPRAKWTPEERLADMDSLGVDVHVVSPYVGFYNYHLDAKVAAATARATNDEISSMTRTWPKRFAGLGTLPMARQYASEDRSDLVLSLGYRQPRRVHADERLDAEVLAHSAAQRFVSVKHRPKAKWQNRGALETFAYNMGVLEQGFLSQIPCGNIFAYQNGEISAGIREYLGVCDTF